MQKSSIRKVLTQAKEKGVKKFKEIIKRKPKRKNVSDNALFILKKEKEIREKKPHNYNP